MRYSLAFKQKAVRRILPPNDESVRSVSKDMGVTENSLYQWVKKAKDGTLGKDGDVSPGGRGAKEKLKLLLEGKVIPVEKQGEWCGKTDYIQSISINMNRRSVISWKRNQINKKKKTGSCKGNGAFPSSLR